MQLKKEQEYIIKYSDRKTINISVERDKTIIVRAPKNVTSEKIQAIVESKRLWLYKKINHTQKYNDTIPAKEFVSGASVMYLGRDYRLEVTDAYDSGIIFNNKFIISKSLQSKANELFKQWFIERAKEIIPNKIQHYASLLGVAYNKILVSNVKYRWGSCTPKNNLNFNWRLIKAPIHVIDYVIVHELAHLLEGNHTQKFWNIVSVQLPNYQKSKEWLKENGDLLEMDF